MLKCSAYQCTYLQIENLPATNIVSSHIVKLVYIEDSMFWKDFYLKLQREYKVYVCRRGQSIHMSPLFMALLLSSEQGAFLRVSGKFIQGDIGHSILYYKLCQQHAELSVPLNKLI